ncbi:MAG: hypothetical protein A2X51_10885 [Candidatus Rokubacteria bacterium GWC2_70_24]|nr:MAG: hypothetical protein A2X51_10885 [Candidatus Rokubacteria bacterium GWC2_70_24]
MLAAPTPSAASSGRRGLGRRTGGWRLIAGRDRLFLALGVHWPSCQHRRRGPSMRLGGAGAGTSPAGNAYATGLGGARR